MANHQRPKEGFTFAYGGMKLNAAPEVIGPNKSVLGVNIRGYGDTHVRTRPGMAQLFTTANFPVTDIGSYAALGTDNRPRLIARLSNDTLWLDNGTQHGTLAGGGASPGATFIPFRPNQSPQSYLYIANGFDYRKLSAPSATNVISNEAVGLPEPQNNPVDAAPNAAPDSLNSFDATGVAANWTASGTAAAPSNSSRISDTVVSAALVDPASTHSATPRYSIQVGTLATSTYAVGMTVVIDTGGLCIVQDVLPPMNSGTAIAIAGIYYYDRSNLNGLCVVVPVQTPTDETLPDPGSLPAGSSLYASNPVAGVRRGSLIKFSGSSEVCLVLRVQKGPDGTYSLLTSTTLTHTTAETLTGVPALVVQSAVVPFGAVNAADIVCNITSGIAKLTRTFGTSPFKVLSPSGLPAQPDDYIHFSIALASLSATTEIKLLFDVGDGSFTQNFFYTVIRPNDIAAGISNTLTQLGVAQLVTQRRIIDEEKAKEAKNQGTTASSYQSSPLDGQFAEIWVPLKALTRVGTDQTKTLSNCLKIQILANTTGTQFTFAALWIGGGGQMDTGPSGAPYTYRVRPRLSTTGVKGNPSPAMPYGVSPRRQKVIISADVVTPGPGYDTLDYFRYGGTVTSWRYIGSVRPATPQSPVIFTDNFDDPAIAAANPLDFDNLEPWPTIDLPLATTAAVTGTTALVPLAASANLLRLLPGNLVQLGGQRIYTLRCRPYLIIGDSLNCLFQFEENAGVGTSVALTIYEPLIAQQRLPYMWGPDTYGTVFACGDALRPGTISFSKPNDPDAAPDRFNIEITPSSEPLLGGETLGGLSFVASTERWWALYPQLSNPTQRYAPVQQPIPRGLAAPYGHCTDGREIFFWAKDGIWSHKQGSLTDADLYNLFPHEGVPGEVVSLYGRGGLPSNIAIPPDYSRAGTFRLTHSNGFLYALYQDSTGVYNVLTYDMRRKAWTMDNYQYIVNSTEGAQVTNGLVSAFYHAPQQEGTVLSHGSTSPMLYAGTVKGQVGAQTDLTNDFGQPIGGRINTFEWDGGDLRFGGSIWGDAVLDATLPAPTGMTVAIVQAQLELLPPIVIPQRVARDQNIISLGGGLVANFLGVALQWKDDYTQQAAPTELHLWQPSFLDKPETIADRITDWDDGGSPGNKWWQGFVLHADTDGADKLLAVRDADTLALHPFSPIVNHPVESQRAYSFNVPFLAHMVRIEPQDQVPWRFYAAAWVTEQSPELAETWQTQGTSHELQGYQHVKQVSVAYAATQPVTLTITTYDGQSPAAILLPATGGAMQKVTRQLTPNKGLLYFYKATSAAPFQLFLPDWEITLGAWDRGQAGYTRYQALGGAKGDQAKV